MQNIILFLQYVQWFIDTYFPLICVLILFSIFAYLIYLFISLLEDEVDELDALLHEERDLYYDLSDKHYKLECELHGLYKKNPQLITKSVIEKFPHLRKGRFEYLKKNKLKIPKWLKPSRAKLEEFPEWLYDWE